MEQFFESLLNWRSDLSAWAIPTFHVTDVIDILVVAFIIYEILKGVRRTGAWILLRGVLLLMAVAAISALLQLKMTLWIFQATISVGILAVIIIFQPELRRALEQLGRGSFLSSLMGQDDNKLEKQNVESIIDALEKMAAVKTGALICLQQTVPLTTYEETGIPLDAEISSQLIVNIFEKNTPLHDGAVIIRDNRIMAATCYLPLTDNPTISKELGTRHRAALGLSEATDSKILIVSEETGSISMAEGGQLYRHVDGPFLRKMLITPVDEKMKRKTLRDIFKKKER